ncbi:MAG: OsmC domain/YcaO domain-containing protein [Halobacteriovoraceae bacterium]|nr:OsmC domain/YcaO domain-containing protein [Halobacteriovoraceae bacterium]|tara:strand:- start:2517 stop:4685 length:2169 start_codon:yes stop_codon:yes gene_type:complete
MQIETRYLENLRLEARFDDFQVISDQPIRYNGDGTAPGPFDYFLASSAMCAAYFVKVYCNARNIPTEGIIITHDNIVSPENRYKQTFHLKIKLPDDLSEKDRQGILQSMERCTVKRVIQNSPEFIIEVQESDGDLNQLTSENNSLTHIHGKDKPLEQTIEELTGVLNQLGIKIEIASWRNPIPHVWSVHIRDADSPMCFTNGKGATKDAALCSALGEYLERISNNYFYNDFYLGEQFAHESFVHYPDEKWFEIKEDDQFPEGLMDDYLLETYGLDGELNPKHLLDMNSGLTDQGVCALPYIRQSDQQTVYIPVNLIGNLFVSNGMSAGNSKYEARVQALSEIFERAAKNKIISEEITLPNIPEEKINSFPKIKEGIDSLRAKGYPLLVKDASLGGVFPVVNITLINPLDGGIFASFGAHPNFEVALERTLTELLQGRSFEGLNGLPKPTFNEFAVTEINNIVDHFIDSTGVISWKFFASKADYPFVDWNFTGSTEEEFSNLMDILTELDKEVYIADYTDLGAHACRIIVPDFSEIYEKEDLIWDNHNKALHFRDDILNIHSLNDQQLQQLVERLEESELDDYMPISELIGIAFDENSTWGQMTIAELKCLSFLKLGLLEQASEQSSLLIHFNEYLPDRRKFFNALNTLLDIALNPELQFEDYQDNLNLFFDAKNVLAAQNSIQRKEFFYNIPQTDSKLTGLTKHIKLIESYQKLHAKRKKLI